MKKSFATLLLLLSIYAKAQVKIGGTPGPAHSSAVLELDGGITKGFLLPRMPIMEIYNLPDPANGLMIFCITDGKTYLRSNGAWVVLANTAEQFNLPYSNSMAYAGNLFSITQTAGSFTAIYGQGQTGGTGVHGRGIGGGYGIKGTSIGIAIAGYFNNSTQNGGVALVTDTGRVGFGTVSPDAFFQVDATKSNFTAMMVNDESPVIQMQASGVSKGYLQASGNNLRIGTNSGNDPGRFYVTTNGADRFVIDSLGRVGIGVGASLPGARLEVSAMGTSQTAMIIDDENPTLQFQNSGVNKGALQLNGDDIRLGTNVENTDGRVILRSGGFDRVYLNNNGSMSIGTTVDAPGYIFRVGGKMIAEEIRVKLKADWADYVFNKNYKLKTLPEVEAFIKINNHLPGIPSAKKIKEEGISIGDMQQKQMEKIEELTLYIIEMQKKMEVLEKLIRTK